MIQLQVFLLAVFLFMYNFDKSFIMDIPKEFLSKEFVSQFKTADDVDSFPSRSSLPVV